MLNDLYVSFLVVTWLAHPCVYRLGLGWTLLLTPYGERLKDMRRILHHDFNYDAVKQFRGIELKACHELLRRLVSRPERFMEDIRQ